MFEKACGENYVQQTQLSIKNVSKSFITISSRQKLCNLHYVGLLVMASRQIMQFLQTVQEERTVTESWQIPGTIRLR